MRCAGDRDQILRDCADVLESDVAQAGTAQLYNFSIRALDMANGPATQTQIAAYQCPSDNAAGRRAQSGYGSYWARANVAVQPARVVDVLFTEMLIQ